MPRKPLAEIFISDSLTSRIELMGSTFEHYRRDNESESVNFKKTSSRLERFPCVVPRNNHVFHFVFSGWKMTDGFTEQMKEIVLRHTSKFTIVKVYMIVGINDIRFVYFFF
jgi:hypothetical protein